MFYVYVLKSAKDGNYYVGFTANIKDRIKRHIEGRSKATKSRQPINLLGFKEFSNQKEAQRCEREFKKHRTKQFIEKKLVEWSGSSIA